ncbi:cytochrome d ubiquinol oxidase subunit II, partial [Staphylococcus pettenkoferi]|nr:cytochrome d ubiquinol oxidase subunit II [Staphylococcus pettenkoferi]
FNFATEPYLLYPYVRLEHGAVNDNMAIALIIAFISVFLLLITLLILLVKLFIFNKKYVEDKIN